VALKPPPPPSVTALACRNCGAPLEIRALGRSVVVACGACGAMLDAQDFQSPADRFLHVFDQQQARPA